ncbi:ribosome rescue factor HflX [Candidatus Methylocalor cossyra]|uniref:GTPase HflX n=1 Tax=Candidatus Methylocalor cossyra TaxID=3108543 RepID=A0ABP1C7P0_9GAMM
MTVSEDTGSLEELRELAISAGLHPVAMVTGRRQAPDPRYFLGKGKLDELLQTRKAEQADRVVFNQPLTPSQERNLEAELGIRVIDRTGLILEIFAQRAQSFEGKLQVELAQLRHISARLVRGWSHLERQKGGIGLRGPGETQLETDKRLLRRRIAHIEQKLKKVEQRRDQGRLSRKCAQVPVIGMVGYTNAGKSTLFNALTGATVQVADQLFATLDPTLRRMRINSTLTVVVADTVGFIRALPHELVAAFKSTLREAAEADLLLHVVDVSDDRVEETMAEVENVLGNIGADRVPRIQVFNKIDKCPGMSPRIAGSAADIPKRVWLSAKTGAGIPLLMQAITEHFMGGMVRRKFHLAAGEASLRARLHGVGRVLREESDGAGGWYLEVEVPQGNTVRLRSP